MPTEERVLSWGCGVQSTTLAVLSAYGEIDHLDAIITADTGWERRATYEIRDWYTKWLRERGMHVEILQTGNIREQGAEAHIHMPFWTADGGPLRRQCTREFKVRPVQRRIRELLGYDASNPPHPPAGVVELWMGITLDEWTRAKPSRVGFITHRWPLLEMRWEREMCRMWLEDHGLPVPPKSACIGCPYRRAGEWLEMRNEAPDEWAAAVAFDEQNRCNPLAERDGSSADELYIYNGLHGPEPLAGANLEIAAARERRIYGAVQLPFACESGFCGT